MEITFKNLRLKALCESEKALIKKYGKVCATKIITRLDDLQAALTLDEFKCLPGRCHELTGDRKWQLTLDLVHPLRLVFKPTDQKRCQKADGGINWHLVDAVEILDVEDTHV